MTEARSALLKFFNATSLVKNFGPRTHPVVRDAVFTTIQGWKLELPAEVWQKSADCGVDVAITSYRAASVEQQVDIALFTFLACLFDDAVIGVQTMRDFVPRFQEGRGQTHPMLTRFQEMTLKLRTYCPPATANTLVTSVMEYANMDVFLEQESLQLASPEAAEYVEYMRMKHGMPELYAALIWPRDLCPNPTAYVQAMPAAFRYVNYVNDLFSYYKEARDGETANYLSLYGKVHGKTTDQTLMHLVDVITSAYHAIREILKEDTAERSAWEHFAAGYVQFHVQSRRYRLDEVIPDHFNL